MRKMKDSGIEWIGEIPEDWNLVATKYYFYYHKYLVKDKHIDTTRLALTLNGVICRSKENNDGLQPVDFSTYQFVNENDLIFKLIDLENVKTSRVGISSKDGMVSPAYIILTPKKDVKFYFWQYYSLWQNNVFNSIASNGVRANLTKSDLLEIQLAVAPFKNRNLIASYLDSKTELIDKTIELTKEQIDKLKEYKQSLITETVTKGLDKNVKMKDSGVEWIGEIPEHWEVRKLRFLGILQNGVSKGKEYFGEGYPFINYGDVYSNITLPNNVEGLANSSIQDRNIYSVKAGDVFFTRTSETIEEIGFVSTCLDTIINAVFSGFLIRFRANSPLLNRNYSKYYFYSNIHRNFFVKEMNIVTRTSLSQSLLKNMIVILPSIHEQKKISEYLDDKIDKIDRMLNVKQNLIEKLEEYKKSLIYECVTGKKEII